MKEYKDNLIEEKLNEYAENAKPSRSVIYQARSLATQPRSVPFFRRYQHYFATVAAAVVVLVAVLTGGLLYNGANVNSPSPLSAEYSRSLQTPTERFIVAKSIADDNGVLFFDSNSDIDVLSMVLMPYRTDKPTSIKFTCMFGSQTVTLLCDKALKPDAALYSIADTSSYPALNALRANGAEIYLAQTSVKMIYNGVSYLVTSTSDSLYYLSLLR